MVHTSSPSAAQNLPDRLHRGIQELVNAGDAVSLRQALSRYPELLCSSLDVPLTQRLQEAWARGSQTATRDLLACRAFLAQCRSERAECILAGPLALPLGRESPLGQLLRLTYKRVDLPLRAKLARQALADVRRASEPDLWASLQREMADCLAQSEGLDRAEHLEEALEAYQAALEVWDHPPDAGSSKWAQTLHAMATTFRYRVRGERADNLKRALRLYRKALTVRTEKDHPLEWAETQQNMGNAWLEMPIGSRAKNVEKGIQCYKAALKVRTRQVTPDLWAQTIHNLALAYIEHPGGDRAENLERAIQICQDVSETRSLEKHPLDWGRSQVALGNAYGTRLQGDRTDNLERAIHCYQGALDALPRELYPADWARAHYNLAVTYRHRLVGDEADNLGQAITHYRQALMVYTLQAYPMEWAHVQTGLGNTYCQPAVGQRATSLEQAIACYQAALTVRTRDNDPTGWATIQNNLGNACADRVLGQQADNQEQAIACYQHALRVRTRQATPARWAETMNNLGAVYSERLRGDPIRNQEQAIHCLRQALEIHTPLVFPADSRRAARNLAHILFAQRRWAEAANYCEVAIEATERLYQAAATPTARQVELREARDLPAQASYCLARLGRLDKAVEILEHSRARALGEALARNEAALRGASTADQEAFAAIRARIATLEAEARGMDQPGVRDFLAVSADLGQARADLATIVARIRRYIPEFMPTGLDFTAIASVATGARQPLVYVLTTPLGSLALIVPPISKIPSERCMVWLNDFDTDGLNGILGSEEKAGYLHGAMGADIKILMQSLDNLWPMFETALMGPIVACLKKLGYAQAILVPTGTLSLLPLHAVALRTTTFTFAPSVRALQTTLTAAQERIHLSPTLLGIGNPLPNPQPLTFARIEIEMIEPFFAAEARKVFFEHRATRKDIQAALPGATYLHFACHGAFDAEDPLESVLYLAEGDMLLLRDLLDGNLDLSTTWLGVLSACQSGVTDFRHVPDEVIGFPAGFLQARVPGVISTLWPVADISTALLLARFYQHHLQDGLDAAVALQRAQVWLSEATAGEMNLAGHYERRFEKSGHKDNVALRAMRYYQANRNSRPFAHPYYWAAFFYSGASVQPSPARNIHQFP